MLVQRILAEGTGRPKTTTYAIIDLGSSKNYYFLNMENLEDFGGVVTILLSSA